MTVGAPEAGREVLVRRGIALEIFTLLWMTVEAAVAVAAGVAAGSVALLAFGIDSVIEFVAALLVLQTFRAEQTGRVRSGGEQRTLRVTGVTFFLPRRTSSPTPPTRSLQRAGPRAASRASRWLLPLCWSCRLFRH